MVGSDLTTPGFRSTFRAWAAEQTNFPRDVAEVALSHAIGDKVEAAYPPRRFTRKAAADDGSMGRLRGNKARGQGCNSDDSARRLQSPETVRSPKRVAERDAMGGRGAAAPGLSMPPASVQGCAARSSQGGERVPTDWEADNQVDALKRHKKAMNARISDSRLTREHYCNICISGQYANEWAVRNAMIQEAGLVTFRLALAASLPLLWLYQKSS